MTKEITRLSHPLHYVMARRRSPRSGRLRLPVAINNRHPNSFIGRAIGFPNADFIR